jgi:uncharacterized membrane protein
MIPLKSIINRVVPWRFLLFFIVLFAGWFFAMGMTDRSSGLLIGFDIAAIAFLASCIPTFFYDVKRLRRVAKETDANRAVLLVISFVLTVVILAAIIAELSAKDSLSPAEKLGVAGSLVLIWIFANAVYTLHYAHLYYTSDDGGKDCAGLIFPGTRQPLMSDFAYYAFTLGVAVQTSDVQVNSRHIRNVTTIHSIVGFFFNLGVLALTINVLGSG